jgi:predicted N-acetyltransferase YhbS
MDLRRATRDDLDSLADALSRAYSWPSPPRLDFPRMYPHLFSDARIGDHHLAIVGREIVGVVGAYPYEIRIDGVVVQGAAIGQVATVPSWRRQGIMAKLMPAALRELEDAGVVLTWLSGDHHLHGRNGYAPGGVTVEYEFYEPKVDAPEPGLVTRMSQAEVVRTLIEHRDRLRNALLVDESELAQVVAARDTSGHRLGDGWVIHDARGGHIHFGDGPVEAIERLLLYLLARAPINAQGMFTLRVECSDEPTALGRACLRRHHSSKRRPSCLWRIGALVPFLTKLCEIASPRLGDGEGTLGLVNTNTGERATLECRAKALHVREGADDSAIALDTRALSALCFGPEPLDYLVPELPLDSPFRRVFPIHAHHTWLVPA